MNTGPVFIIDDDVEELDIVKELWQELNFPNSLETFTLPADLIKRLKANDQAPFIIISDVHLPQMDGFELRQRLAKEDNMRYKTIPFIFWSTTASNTDIKTAYDSGGHGFFFKGSTYQEISASLRVIMNYWAASKIPEKK